MKRKLLKQITTEWRSNLWLWVELLIISVILLFLFDLTASFVRIKNTPVGVDITDVYRLDFGYRNSQSPGYKAAEPRDGETPEEASSRKYKEDLASIYDRLKAMPEIKAAAWGSKTPYSYDFYGSQLYFIDNAPDTLKKTPVFVNQYIVHPDYVKVFNMGGTNGETPEQLARVLEEGKCLVTSNLPDAVNNTLPASALINLRFRSGSDENEAPQTHTIGGTVTPLRRSDYEPAHITVIYPEKELRGRTVYVRLNEGADPGFLKRLSAMDSPVSVGNFYLIEAKQFIDIRNDLHRNDDAQHRNVRICMAFLLLTVFLGLLGTFWFRTQQRVQEIAIRMTTGAARVLIFRRLMGEGLMILAMATIPAMGLDALLVHYELLVTMGYFPGDNIWITVLIEALAVAALMALMIVAGIYFPARKAMRIEPADVLRGE